MIQKFIAGLNDVQKKLVAGGLAVLVIVLFYLLLINPTMSKLSSIDGDIVKEESSIKQDLHFLSQKSSIVKQSEALDVYVIKDLPTEEELIAAFLKKLESLAGKANVTLAKVTPAAGQQEKGYIKYQGDLECSGKLADVITFMHLVNSSDDLLKVVKFNLGAKKGDTEDSIKAVMTISKMVVGNRPADPKSATPSK